MHRRRGIVQRLLRIRRSEVATELAAQGNQTLLTYDADTQVGGLIANVGQRMISGVAKMIINQALKKLEEELAQY